MEKGPGVRGGVRPSSVPRGLKGPVSLQEFKPEDSRLWFEQGARAMGISLTDLQVSRFMEYLFLLQKWNRVINLTGLHTWAEIIVKHFLDSLTILPYLPETFRLLDLGSGAGFPGLPIKIMHPNQTITLIEASAKKVSFLREVVRRLGLPDLTVIPVFLNKNTPVLPGLEEPFNLITSRAVGRLPGILTSARDYLTNGGKLVLLKGRKGVQEIITAAPLIEKSGFQLEEPIFLTLPLLNQERTLIFLTKTGFGE